MRTLLISLLFAAGFYHLVYNGKEPFGLLAGVICISMAIHSYLQPPVIVTRSPRPKKRSIKKKKGKN